MLVTVSTVKETTDGLERFVTRNLACGVDHMVVFVDDGDPKAMAWLSTHPHVTAVDAGRGWWSGNRPSQLNARQKSNANVLRSLLAVDSTADWLFHIDGDEVLLVDRAALSSVPASAGVVHAPPMEAVSRVSWPGDEVTHFKRLLGHDDLVLLQVLGLVTKPSNSHYFHGHVKGKSGMRPSMDRWFSLHEVTGAGEQPLPPYAGGTDGVARLLHYESWSGEEFVRKWSNILSSGALPSFRGNRRPTAVALRALLARDLADETRRALLMRIFQRTTEDDFETLRDLGLLEELHPGSGGHVPAALNEQSRERLTRMLAAVQPLDKRSFRSGATAAAAGQVLETMASRLEHDGHDRDDVARCREVWASGSNAGGVARWARRRGRAPVGE
jgi:hypothetical protein